MSYSASFWKTKESFLIVNLLSCNSPSKQFLAEKLFAASTVKAEAHMSNMKNQGNMVSHGENNNSPGTELKGIVQEKKALSSRGRGRLRGFLELRRPWGFSPEARRGSQGASRAAPGKSGLHARGEGERVLALESREGTRASRRVEEGLSRSLSGGTPTLPAMILRLFHHDSHP